MFRILLLVLFSASCVHASLKDVRDRLYSMSVKEELLPVRHEKWIEDYEKGRALAAKTGKPLLIAFLGTPWCRHSEQMEKEVLSEHGFVSKVSEKFVMVALTLSEAGGKGDMRERYGIDQVPTLLLAKSNGKEMTRVAYDQKRPEAMASELVAIADDFEEVQRVVEREDLTMFQPSELRRLYQVAKEKGFERFRERLFLAGLHVDQGLFFLLEQYNQLAMKGLQDSSEGAAVRKKVAQRDPKNEQGGYRSLALMDFEALSSVCEDHKKEVKAAVKPLLTYVKKFGKQDPDHTWEMELRAAEFLSSKNRLTEALEHAKLALKGAPDHNKSPIIDLITYLEIKK